MRGTNSQPERRIWKLNTGLNSRRSWRTPRSRPVWAPRFHTRVPKTSDSPTDGGVPDLKIEFFWTFLNWGRSIGRISVETGGMKWGVWSWCWKVKVIKVGKRKTVVEGSQKDLSRSQKDLRSGWPVDGFGDKGVVVLSLSRMTEIVPWETLNILFTLFTETFHNFSLSHLGLPLVTSDLILLSTRTGQFGFLIWGG